MPEEVVAPEQEVVEVPEEPKAEEAPVETPPAEEPAAVESEPAEPAKGKSFQRRIDQLTWRAREAEREAEFWKRKAMGEEPVKPSAPAHQPKPEEFDTTEEFINALTDWKVDQARASIREEISQSQQAEEIRAIQTRFNDQVSKAREKYEDFDEVVGQPIFTPALQTALQDSEHGAEIAYFLGTHGSELERLVSMSVGRMFKEVGKMEAKFSEKPPDKTVTKAPPPIAPVKGVAPTTKDPMKMTAAEYLEAKRAGLIK